LLGTQTVTFDGLLDLTAAIANFQVYGLTPLFSGLPAPLILTTNLLDVLASSVEDLYFTWRRLGSHTNFKEHVGVCNNVDVVVSSSLQNYVLFFGRAYHSSEFVQNCFALLGNFLKFFFAIGGIEFVERLVLITCCPVVVGK
jgi:hypothetical protein